MTEGVDYSFARPGGSALRTAGYLVHKNKRFINIAMNSDAPDETYGEVMAIPRSCVKKMRRLK